MIGLEVILEVGRSLLDLNQEIEVIGRDLEEIDLDLR